LAGGSAFKQDGATTHAIPDHIAGPDSAEDTTRADAAYREAQVAQLTADHADALTAT
jgi:hypothetical protein